MPPAKKNAKSRTKPTQKQDKLQDAMSLPEELPGQNAGPLFGASGEKNESARLPVPAAEYDEIDEEIIMTFLTCYHSLEQAMLQAGFTRGSARPDWIRFVRHIEGQFDPDASPVLQAAVDHMLYNPEFRRERETRLEQSFPWESASPDSDIVWLSEIIQKTYQRLLHEMNFPDAARCNTTFVSAASFVLEDWAQLDPEIEKLMSGL